MKKLLEMLTYCRPEGSPSQAKFCKKYLTPVMGEPDKHGNYIHIIGDSQIAFMAHHDTVHHESGKQKLFVDPVLNQVHSDSSCLGADCTTGVWLILEMIAQNVPGVYIVHAAEEVGCLGSRALVEDNPEWLDQIQFAISFDRKGTQSIITHQMGQRTSSEQFAQSLQEALGLELYSDDTGSYTDSNEYAYCVSECTNLSVGYYGQHTSKEFQDLTFAETLRDALIEADWSLLVAARDPNQQEAPLDQELHNYVYDHPDLIAEFLEDHDITMADILEYQRWEFAA